MLTPFQWKWIWVVFSLGGLVFLLLYQCNSYVGMKIITLYETFRDYHQLREFILSFGPYSPIAYIFLQVFQVIVAPIPGGAIEFLGGYLFGVKAGLIYSMIGLLLGSWLAFSLAKIFGRAAVEKFVSLQMRRKYDYLIGHQGVILSFILFLIPGFPKDALCYILGLTPMHLGIFLIISTIGRIPGTLIATLQGANAFNHQYKAFLILSGISAVVILVFYIYHEEIHRRIKRLKKV